MASCDVSIHRPWWRLHPFTWCVVLLALIPLVLLIVPGESPGLSPVSWKFEDPPFEHGWPWTFLNRGAIEEWRIDLTPVHFVEPGQRAAWESWDAWRLTHHVKHFDVLGLFGDVAVAVAILGVVAALGEAWVRSRQRWWQFGIKPLLAFTAMLAIVLAWWRANAVEVKRENAFVERWFASPVRHDALVSLMTRSHTTSGYIGSHWLSRLLGTRRLSMLCRIRELSFHWDNSFFSRGESGVFPKRNLRGEGEFAPDMIAEAAASLRYVREVSVDEHQSNSVVQVIAALPTVEAVTFDGSPNATALAELSRLKNLKQLTIHGGRTTDAHMQVIAALPELESVDLSFSEVTDSRVQILQGCPKLKVLHIALTEVTDDGEAALRRSCPTLTIVRDLRILCP